MAKNIDSELFQDIANVDKREATLKANCDNREETVLQVEFTPEELEEKRNDLMENSIKIDHLKKRFAHYKALIDERMKPLQKENDMLVQETKTGYQLVNGEVYLFADLEAGQMGYYDRYGILQNSRRLLPEERQSMIRQNNPVLASEKKNEITEEHQ